MPRSATTLLGLALVALSIVFNTVRYPAVWEMVASERLGETPPATPPKKPDSPNDRTSTPAKNSPVATVQPIEVQPTEAIAKVDAGQEATLSGNDGRAVAESSTPGPTDPPPYDAGHLRLDRKPLVPITPVVSATDSTTGSVVRRLPPVESTPAGPFGQNAAALGNPAPWYPSTGLQ
ncbi:MAG: hypothetical protein LLF97_12475 [Planctomycetaceae bacterium]|nr:hypothetical protein [Planctomycetaceae bacterium]